MATTDDAKSCETCGGAIKRRSKLSAKEWLARRFCSNECQSEWQRSSSAKSVGERVASRVVRRNGCLEWTGSIDGKGYGYLNVARRRVAAHRASWTVHNGPIPDGMCVCHRCDNPKCVDPEHMFLGTHRDNMRDMAQKGRGRRVGFGEDSPRHILTWDAVSDIRKRSARGEQQKDIAASLGVSQTTISSVVRRKTWVT